VGQRLTTSRPSDRTDQEREELFTDPDFRIALVEFDLSTL
jgi:hypothetical protein